MIIEKTNYPWTAQKTIFEQSLTSAYGTLRITADVISKDRHGIILREYDTNNKCSDVMRFRYCSLFSFVQAVKQIVKYVYGLNMEWNTKEFFISEEDNGYSELD